MRKVVVYELMSVDGVAEDPDEFISDWDSEMDAHLGAVIATQDDVILGRASYEEWARFWPSSDIEPFASFINAVPKHVATSSPLDKGWANATAIDGDLVEFVRGLKDGEGGDIGVHASMSVAQNLLGSGVVDELVLVVGPNVLGRGRRLFEGVPKLRLETASSEMTPSGALLLAYRVAVV